MKGLDEFRALAPLSEQMPLKLENGSTITGIGTQHRCGKDPGEEFVRGRFTCLGDGYSFELLMWCPHCAVWGVTVGMVVQNGKGWAMEGPKAREMVQHPWAAVCDGRDKEGPLPQDLIGKDVTDLMSRLFPKTPQSNDDSQLVKLNPAQHLYLLAATRRIFSRRYRYMGWVLLGAFWAALICLGMGWV